LGLLKIHKIKKILGVKASGIGTQEIKYCIESMSRPKATVINLTRG